MRIDSHQHFWKYNQVRDSWIDESMQIIRRDFLPTDLKPILDQFDFQGCVAVQADQSEEETRFLLKLADKNPFIKGVIGWVDLCDENVEERLSHFSKYGLFKGIRHILQGENSDFMLQTDFQNGISKLRQFDLTYDILVHYSQLTSVIKLVTSFPEQQFIVDHIAKPNIKDQEMDVWSTQMGALAKFPNVFCKVSGLVTEASWNSWNYSDLKPYLDVVFNAFGVERILYGSDWPVCLLSANYQQQLHIFEEYISSYSSEDQLEVMGGNAIKFYNLKS